MEPVEDRAELIEEALRGQSDMEDWLWNDCDLTTGDAPEEDE